MIDPERIIDETATIQETNIEVVYDQCISWLRLKKFQIWEQEKPTFIEALLKETTMSTRGGVSQ